jgi:hypothetical protein
MGRHAASSREGDSDSRRGRVRPRGSSTVWACAEGPVHAGMGRLDGWLLTAVIKVVTTYSSPGDRVLLVEPAPGMRRFRGVGPYGGLAEAVWPVVRLGRGVRTQVVGEEVGGLGPVSNGFDVVIVAAEPDVVVRMRPSLAAGALTSDGVLAVITHSGRALSGFLDPTAGLVRAAHEDGLRYLDRIVLVQVPSGTACNVGDHEAPASAVWDRVHADLHVFGRVTADV